MKALQIIALLGAPPLLRLGRVTLDLVEQYPEALMKKCDPGTEVATSGVKNGLLLKLTGTYHYFTSIWTDPV